MKKHHESRSRKAHFSWSQPDPGPERPRNGRVTPQGTFQDLRGLRSCLGTSQFLLVALAFATQKADLDALNDPVLRRTEGDATLCSLTPRVRLKGIPVTSTGIQAGTEFGMQGSILFARLPSTKTGQLSDSVASITSRNSLSPEMCDTGKPNGPDSSGFKSGSIDYIAVALH